MPLETLRGRNGEGKTPRGDPGFGQDTRHNEEKVGTETSTYTPLNADSHSDLVELPGDVRFYKGGGRRLCETLHQATLAQHQGSLD